MTVKKPKLTKAMRRVLERMEKGEALRASWGELGFDKDFFSGGFHFGTWDSYGGRPETVYKTTARALLERGFITSGTKNNHWYVTTPAGRKALKENGDEMP